MKLIQILALLSAAVLSGCATTPGPYGNYLEPQTSEAYSQQLAQDVATQMARVWAPAQTELSLEHPAKDGFGVALVDALRGAGFAVREYDEHGPGGKSQQEGPAVDVVSGSTGSELRYVVDQLDKFLVRVSVAVGEEGIARAYSTEGGSVTPAGIWAIRKGQESS
jgi:type IV secretion system protein TrbH